MRCPQCDSDAGSVVYIYGSTTTDMAVDSYYDKDGKYHYHDINVISTPYNCSEGHSGFLEMKNSCSCGWVQK